MSHIDAYLSHLKPQIAQLNQIIKNNQTFLLIGHRNPDADCISSMLALGHILTNLDKHVYYFTPTALRGERLNWLPGIEQVQHIVDNTEFLSLPESDVTIFLDLSWPWLLEWAEQALAELKTKYKVCIDHHLNPSLDVNLLICDTSSSSCAELIREISQELYPALVDKNVATLCYVWFVCDTGGSLSNGLEFEKDTVRSCENIISMIKHWLDKPKVLEELKQISLVKLQFANLILDRITASGDILRSWYTDQEHQQYGTDGWAGLWMDLMRKVEWEWLVLRFCIYDDIISCSLRSKWSYDVQVIAKHFGGWWHKKAAWCRIARNGEELQLQLKQIVNEINTMLDQQHEDTRKSIQSVQPTY